METTCPCKKKTCPRHRDCEAYRAHHSGSVPYCERRKKKPKQQDGIAPIDKKPGLR